MARLRDVARQLKPVAEEGIGWMVIWRTGTGWNGTAVWPEYIEKTFSLILDDEDRELISSIVEEDPQAILVNSYIHNVGVRNDRVTTAALEEGLHWQYKEGMYMAKDAL